METGVGTARGLNGLIARLERLLEKMEQAGRRPDRWEDCCVLRALDALHEGDLLMAEREITFAETPPELRPPKEVAKIFAMQEIFTIGELRDSFEEIKARSWKARPHDRGEGL
jgi:hypothetical protein